MTPNDVWNCLLTPNEKILLGFLCSWVVGECEWLVFAFVCVFVNSVLFVVIETFSYINFLCFLNANVTRRHRMNTFFSRLFGCVVWFAALIYFTWFDCWFVWNLLFVKNMSHHYDVLDVWCGGGLIWLHVDSNLLLNSSSWWCILIICSWWVLTIRGWN